MKKILSITVVLPLLAGCYEDYLQDFDYSAGYVAYQYDLRSFIPGEFETLNFTVCLGGVSENTRDRSYEVVMDDSLVDGDLSVFTADGTSFRAIDGMKGTAPIGNLAGGSASYIKDAFASSDVLTLLPKTYYEAEPGDVIVSKGRHTGVLPVTMTQKMLEDPDSYVPHYALGFRIVKADVDSLLLPYSFSVIGYKIENRYFGTWYHGGKTVREGGTIEYPLQLPQEDVKLYTLTTVDSKTVRTNRIGQDTGSLLLTFWGNQISIDSDDVKIVPDGRKSWVNDVVLLQDRKIYLNYSYKDPLTEEIVAVSDSLVFRNRVRDGINEWQDENESHYSK